MEPVELSPAPLAGFDAGDRARLIAEASRFVLAPGEVLFRQGDLADALYVVETGSLTIATRLPGDDSVDLAPIGPGEVVGEFALLDEAPRSARVTAAEHTTGWRVSRARFHALLADANEWALRLSTDLRRLVASRTRATIERIARDDAGDVASLRTPGSTVRSTEPVSDAAMMVATLVRLAGLGPDGAAALTATGETLAIARGTRLLVPGANAETCDFVLRGALRSALLRGDRVEQLSIHGPGEATGLVAFHDNAPQPLLVETAENSVILRVPAQALAAALTPTAVAPEWNGALAVILGRQLVRDQRRANRHLGRALALEAFNAAGNATAGGPA